MHKVVKNTYTEEQVQKIIGGVVKDILGNLEECRDTQALQDQTLQMAIQVLESWTHMNLYTGSDPSERERFNGYIWYQAHRWQRNAPHQSPYLHNAQDFYED